MGSLSSQESFLASSLAPQNRKPRGKKGLSKEQELELIAQVQNSNDQRAMKKLLESFDGFIRKITSNISSRSGRDQEDVYQEGVIGFIEAVKRYDPDKGNGLSAYANHYIKEKALDFVRNNHGPAQAPVRIPISARRKLSAYYEFLSEKGYDESRLTVEQTREVCEAIGTSTAKIDRLKGIFRAGSRVSLDAPLNEKNDSTSSNSFGDFLEDDSDSAFDIINAQMGTELIKKILADANLKERERIIINQRILADDPVTLEILSNRFEITRERVRQIEQRALEKIRRALRSYMSDQFGSSQYGMEQLGIL